MNTTPHQQPTQAAIPAHPTPSLRLLVSREGYIMEASRSVGELLGLQYSDLVRTPVANYLPERVRPRIQQALSVPSHSASSTFTLRLLPPVGEPIVSCWRAYPIAPNIHSSHHFHLAGYPHPPAPDLTWDRADSLPTISPNDWSRPVSKLPNTATLFRSYPRLFSYLETLVDAHMDGALFVETYPDRQILLTEASFALLGLSSDDLPDPFRITDYIHPEDLATALTYGYVAPEAGEVRDFTYRVVTPAGRVRHIRQYTTGAQNPEQEGAAAFGLCIDVTDGVIADRTQRALIKALEVTLRATNEADLVAGVAQTLHSAGGFRYVAFYALTPQTGYALVAEAGDSRWLDTDIDEVLNKVDMKNAVSGDMLTSDGHPPSASTGEPENVFLPICLSGDLALVLGVWSEEPSAFTGSSAPRLAEFAGQLETALGKIVEQRPVALAGQRLAQVLAEPSSDIDTIRTAAAGVMSAISAAGDSKYWRKYTEWSTHPHWTIPDVSGGSSTYGDDSR